jgi:hypothetical protein
MSNKVKIELTSFHPVGVYYDNSIDINKMCSICMDRIYRPCSKCVEEGSNNCQLDKDTTRHEHCNVNNK